MTTTGIPIPNLSKKQKLFYHIYWKNVWLDGIWSYEPDYRIWHHKGMLCVISRDKHRGYLKGYVVIPEGHAMFNSSLDSFGSIQVHGGINYFDEVEEFPGAKLLGFHCGHQGDWSPYVRKPYKDWEGGYRDMNYVVAQVHQLAEQLLHLNALI